VHITFFKLNVIKILIPSIFFIATNYISMGLKILVTAIISRFLQWKLTSGTDHFLEISGI
jgi:hypothetical protein